MGVLVLVLKTGSKLRICALRGMFICSLAWAFLYSTSFSETPHSSNCRFLLVVKEIKLNWLSGQIYLFNKFFEEPRGINGLMSIIHWKRSAVELELVFLCKTTQGKHPSKIKHLLVSEIWLARDPLLFSEN